MSRAKGRPPIIPRIEALEKRVYDWPINTGELVSRLIERVEALEQQRSPVPRETSYKPMFDRWPGNGR